jgi:aspartyl-tRNA synthetase
MMRTHYVADAKHAVGQEVTLAGWVHEIRDIGKLKFLLLRDRTGILQVTGKTGTTLDAVLDAMVQVKETVVQVQGTVKENKIAPGGLELSPSEIKVLGEVTVKVPFEVTGKVPADLDVRLDHRYVDLRRKETQAIFRIKHTVAAAFREKVIALGFQEMVPTCIVAAATEGGTNLFPVQYFERSAFLAQSPQLYKQLAVIGGMDKVFMTTPAFRAEKHNTKSHLNEVLQMDIEMGFADHEDAMEVLSQVALHTLMRVRESHPEDLATLETELRVPSNIPRHTYGSIVDLLNKNGVKFEWGEDFSRETEEEINKLLNEELYIIHEWPTKVRAFYSMPNEKNPEICNAYDLMYRGTEISSGAQRIHLPDLLVAQLKSRGLDPDSFSFYVNAFRVGAPPHAGWSIGLERFTMKICNLQNIREVAMFPRDRTRVTP